MVAVERHEDNMFPNYTMSLGGKFDEDSMLGHHTARVPVKRVIPVILKIIELFKENKQPDDTFPNGLIELLKEMNPRKLLALKTSKKKLHH